MNYTRIKLHPTWKYRPQYFDANFYASLGLFVSLFNWTAHKPALYIIKRKRQQPSLLHPAGKLAEIINYEQLRLLLKLFCFVGGMLQFSFGF